MSREIPDEFHPLGETDDEGHELYYTDVTQYPWETVDEAIRRHFSVYLGEGYQVDMSQIQKYVDSVDQGNDKEEK